MDSNEIKIDTKGGVPRNKQESYAEVFKISQSPSVITFTVTSGPKQ